MSQILYTTTSYLPAVGGAQLHTHQVARRIAARRPVQVVTLWNENRTDWLLGTTLRGPVEPESYRVDGVPVELIALSQAERWPLLPYVLGYYAFKPRAIRRIAAALAPKIEPLARRCALIHNLRIGREPLSFASLQVARRLDIPFVFVPYHHPRWVGWNYRQYIDLYRQADALIALTEAEKQTLVELGVEPERVFVTGMGPILADQAHPEQFRRLFQLEADVPLILFVGQKYRYKGLEPLVGAARLVWRRWPEARFCFIGPRTAFSERFFAGQDDPRLVELGIVDLQQKTDALAACTLLCLPSSQESFGGVFTEAWSFGKPVIGANIPAVAEIIEPGVDGYLVEPEAAALADRIEYLLANPTLAQEMGRAGQAKTQAQYNWERLARKTEDVYTTTLR